MSYVAHRMWSITCDQPGCDASAQEGGDFAAWAQKDYAAEEANNAEWATVALPDGTETHYCFKHSRYDQEGERIKADGLESWAPAPAAVVAP